MKTMISDLKVGGEPIIACFAIIQKSSKTTSGGKPFLDIVLGDRSGSVGCRWWDRQDIPAGVGDVVKVAASIDEYPPGKIQLRIDKMFAARAEDYSMAEMLPASERPAEEMYDELVQMVKTKVCNLRLGDVLMRMLEEFRIPLLVAPASKSYHHAFVGGLLEHILGIAKLAMLVAVVYPELNSDVLIAGAILHDIGKLNELRSTLGFGYTVNGKLHGHIMQGFTLVADRFDQCDVNNEIDDVAQQILHVIASHHGELEHGAAVLPQTKEAIIFHELDMIDSRMGAIRAAEKLPVDDDGFTTWIPMFKANYFKGKPECPTQPDPTSQPASQPASQDPATSPTSLFGGGPTTGYPD